MSVESASQLLSTQAAVYGQGMNEEELQNGVQTPAYAATITPTVYKAETLVIPGVLTGNVTIANPIGARTGMRLHFVFTQDGTGSRTVTWGSAFAYTANGAGAASTLGATTFVFNGTRWVQTSGALAFKV